MTHKVNVQISFLPGQAAIYPSFESIEKLREHGYIVTKTTGIKMRMLKVVLPDGEIEVILTDLYDNKIFSLKKMRKLYFMRWRIETTYTKQKNQLQMEIFSGHRVVCIEQESCCISGRLKKETHSALIFGLKKFLFKNLFTFLPDEVLQAGIILP